MIKSKQSLNNISQKSFLQNDEFQFWVKKPRPNYTWLDLIDTERYWQKTYNHKEHFIPTVRKWDWDINIWLELVNYYQFTAYWWPVQITWTNTYTNIFQSFNLPTPIKPVFPEADEFLEGMIPMSYDWFDTLTVYQPWIYNVWFKYSVTLIDNIQAIEFKVISNINWVILEDIISASWKTLQIPWIITSWTDSLWWSISWTTMSTYLLDDLSDIFVIYGWNWQKNVYLIENETLTFTIKITSSTWWPANWIISSADIFLSYLRPNR
jgi:hypothetical protein